MKLSNCVLLFLGLFLNLGFSHDANKSFYKITQKKEVVEVIAEFPWTLRNALLKEYPELESSKNQEDFDTAFFSYIKNNFRINLGERSLQLISVAKGESNGHSHQNNYIFIFKGTRFSSINNTIMCAISKSHKNYHKLQLKGEQLEFVTMANNPVFTLELPPKTNSFQVINSQKKNTVLHEEMEVEQIPNYYYYVPALLIIGFLFFWI